MKLRTFKTINNGIYQIVINVEDISQNDQLLMQKYGEPTVDLGGTFTPEVPAPEFTLPSKVVSIMAGNYVLRQSFDSRDTGYAQANADAWSEELNTRITDAVEAMRQNVDTFTTEEIVSI